jgi:lipopolysaccharide biosynthesis protein
LNQTIPQHASTPDVRLIAFYLPQFHPIPENDEWWGKGFTEWTNVAKARPLFAEHYQPHLPADLGFYDLRVREVMREQAQLAKAHGIDAFCYHYYWFSGKRLLERPLEDMLADPQTDMPFCLCWANENWTRRWDAAENKVLMAQRYLPEDDLAFIQSLEPYFRDNRYLRVGGAPLLVVYRPQQLPDTARTARVWREYCRNAGLGEIHLCAALTHGNQALPDGFDSVVDFPPHNIDVPRQNTMIHFHEPFAGNAFDFVDIARHCLDKPRTSNLHFRGVFPCWDNTARTGSRALVVVNSGSENYEYWLAESIGKAQLELPPGRRLVFINAWNEWAEGCHLEPDRRHGHAFLQATARARNGNPQAHGFVGHGLSSARASKRRFLTELWSLMRYHALLRIGEAGNVLKRYPRIRRLVRLVTRKGR